MKRNTTATTKRFVVREETWMGATVYTVLDTLMNREVLSTLDGQWAQAECNRMN